MDCFGTTGAPHRGQPSFGTLRHGDSNELSHQGFTRYFPIDGHWEKENLRYFVPTGSSRSVSADKKSPCDTRFIGHTKLGEALIHERFALLEQHGIVEHSVIATPSQDGVIRITHGTQELYRAQRVDLHATWSEMT